MGVNHIKTNVVAKETVQLGNNYFSREIMTAASAGVLEVGTVVGRLKTTGKLVVLDPADATNGSCFPVGIVTDPKTMVVGDNKVTIVTSGRVDQSVIKFPVGTTMATVVDNRQLKDYFITAGFELENPHA